MPEDLFVARVDGTQYRRLTDDEFRDRGPAWAPDGTQHRVLLGSIRLLRPLGDPPDGSGLTCAHEGRGHRGIPGVVARRCGDRVRQFRLVARRRREVVVNRLPPPERVVSATEQSSRRRRGRPAVASPARSSASTGQPSVAGNLRSGDQAVRACTWGRCQAHLLVLAGLAGNDGRRLDRAPPGWHCRRERRDRGEPPTCVRRRRHGRRAASASRATTSGSRTPETATEGDVWVATIADTMSESSLSDERPHARTRSRGSPTRSATSSRTRSRRP